ncbi:hypothetical protein A2U01_0111851, partial [Trifolium medium]|nr:hypothetical protein [Trifolium medium]
GYVPSMPLLWDKCVICCSAAPPMVTLKEYL